INISSSSGFTTNSSPSIIEINGGARVVWIGERGDLPSLAKTTNETNITPPQYEWRTIFKDPSYYRYWSFGSNVNSPSINKTDNNSAYVLGWAETNGTVTNKFADNSLSTIRTLNTTGKSLQLCNGADKYSMFALSFTNNALPYNFALSNSIGSVALAKENTSLSVNKGREGVVVKDSSQIYFTLGDVLVNGENISFKTIPDTFSVTSVADVNNYVKTNPFSVTDNSSFFYSVQYGVSNAEQLKRALTESDVVSFRIELVDAATETVLGVFDNISYTNQNAVSYDNFSYEVSTEGIGNRTVYLRLVTTTSEGCSFSITDKLDNQSIIAKRYVKQVAFKSVQVIKDYALEQNYPNPFNPATTITYQLPKSGSVTLKIYDMLGKEVMTLVNEQKDMDRYTVQFDASSLASGMYVYQLRANDYTSTKKMMLLK
ncbi:MAG: T9SS type A sorting domain-containing protein, partial [Ignavibacteria bacterium]|nr:T9SS type A sorting domain-containing protein [Ignavibacteria bacterium]